MVFLDGFVWIDTITEPGGGGRGSVPLIHVNPGPSRRRIVLEEPPAATNKSRVAQRAVQQHG
jgi:hypothetical protein